jgi:hypothetical protein
MKKRTLRLRIEQEAKAGRGRRKESGGEEKRRKTLSDMRSSHIFEEKGW